MYVVSLRGFFIGLRKDAFLKEKIKARRSRRALLKKKNNIKLQFSFSRYVLQKHFYVLSLLLPTAHLP